jgi:hypothetical protein
VFESCGCGTLTLPLDGSSAVRGRVPQMNRIVEGPDGREMEEPLPTAENTGANWVYTWMEGGVQQFWWRGPAS